MFLGNILHDLEDWVIKPSPLQFSSQSQMVKNQLRVWFCNLLKECIETIKTLHVIYLELADCIILPLYINFDFY